MRAIFVAALTSFFRCDANSAQYVERPDAATLEDASLPISPLSLQANICAIVAVLTLGSLCFVETAAAQAQEKDTSGTNPAILTRTLQISSEYRFLPNNNYYNQTLVRHNEPFLEGKAAVRLTLPFDAQRIADNDDFGIGDIAAKLSWIPYTTRRQAVILSTEVFAPTASEDVLGTGKWVVAPGLTWAYFASPEVIIAPAYIQNWSFAGEDDRVDVNRGDFDLYLVYRPHGKRWWITSDTTVSHNFENDTTPVSSELAFGRNLAKFGNGAALNGYIRPGIGIGSDRPYDFNVEVGLSLVNF